MKRNIVTKSIMGALVLAGAIGVNGCSAESAESDPVGRASEALTSCSSSATTTFVSHEERYQTMGCTITDLGNSNPTIVYAGGRDFNASAPTKDIYTSTNGSTFTKAAAQLSVERREIKAFKLDANTCAFVTGIDTNGAVTKKVDLVTTTNGTPSVSTLPDLATARYLPEVSVCNGNLFVVGGLDASNNGLRSVEHYNGSTWDSNANALPTGKGRGNFALAKAYTTDRFALGGGRQGNASVLSGIVGLDASSSCDPNSGSFSVIDVTNVASGAVLSSASEGNVGMYLSTPSAGVDRFVFFAGRTSSSGSLVSNADTIEIDWSTPSNSSQPSTTTTGVTATYRPSFLNERSSTVNVSDHAYLINGSNVNETTSLAIAQEFSSGAWQSSCSTTNGHYLAPLGKLSGVVYTIGGFINGSGINSAVDTAQ